MAREGLTGLVLPVPEADPVLTTVSQGYPEAVRDVPAHISLLYPFLDADALDEQHINMLDDIFRTQPPVPVTLSECRRQEDGFVYLPATNDELTTLTETVRARWPEAVPHERRANVAEPHVTVAMQAPEESATRIQATVTAALPMVTVLQEAWLVVFSGTRWHVREHFSFAVDDQAGDVE
ncbi:2'-5' RNA ligase family protein [Bounagaea algeriensis]